jgi:hypothetical protein
LARRRPIAEAGSLAAKCQGRVSAGLVLRAVVRSAESGGIAPARCRHLLDHRLELAGGGLLFLPCLPLHVFTGCHARRRCRVSTPAATMSVASNAQP